MAGNDMKALTVSAEKAAHVLRVLGNEKRLLVLCVLAMRDKVNVSDLSAEIGLGMSPLSQHLARLREVGLVEACREGQQVFYRIGDPNVADVLKVLNEIYCL
jgi:DNA-binding transcriptional ArsR family regulator